MEKCIIVLSGGMDSGVMLQEIKENYQDSLFNLLHKCEIYALTFDYGSIHNQREQEYAKNLCKKYKVQSHQIIKLDFIKKLFKSSLLQNLEDIPEGHYTSENMKSTIVPFRNGIMLSIAGGYAESIGARCIFIGNHAGDHAIYPDCRLPFISNMKETLFHGTSNNIILKSPYVYLTKRDIALRGKKSNFDFSETYSCYKGEEFHCGKCGTCVERKEALEGFDTTIYTG